MVSWYLSANKNAQKIYIGSGQGMIIHDLSLADKMKIKMEMSTISWRAKVKGLICKSWYIRSDLLFRWQNAASVQVFNAASLLRCFVTRSFYVLGRAAEFDTSMSLSASSSSSAASRPDPPLPAPNLNAAVIVKVIFLFWLSCSNSPANLW